MLLVHPQSKEKGAHSEAWVGFRHLSATVVGLCQVLHLQLESLGLNSKPITDRFVESFKAMWSLNGHGLSKVFTGSRALEGKAKVWSRPGQGKGAGAGRKAALIPLTEYLGSCRWGS